ncbi:unnamed protein product, partial [Staurois parvus]
VHSTAIQSSVLTVKHQHTAPPVKHSLCTVNPLIAPHVNPFLVSAFFFFFSTDHSIRLVSLGMSVTPSQFPPVSECSQQSKSLIAAISS